MNQIDKAVLRKLYAKRVFGSRHIRMTTLLKMGWKTHEKGAVKQSVKKLVRQGLVIWAKKSKKALQLNISRIDEISRWP